MKTNSKFVSILSDYGFKVTFADESDTLFLRKSLQALIQSQYEIEEVHFLRNEFEGQTKDSRRGVYDLACEDEAGNSFIVEMQLGFYKNYIQRAKFYAFQKFNTLVKKGDFFYNALPRIYCIGLLAKNIFPESEEYYHFATLRSQKGEELDHQITHIIVEISKFKKSVDAIQSNLDKLIYIMKNSDKIQKNSDFPSFLTEDWLEKALKRLEEGNMTAEQRMFYNMAIAKNASIEQMEMEEEQRRQEKFQKREEKMQKEFQKQAEKMQKEFQKREEKMQKESQKREEKMQKESQRREERIQKESQKQTEKIEKEFQKKLKGLQKTLLEEHEEQQKALLAEQEKMQQKLLKEQEQEQEQENALKIAKALKDKNMPLHDIAEITGFSVEMLKEL